jgi:hypothetical protein
MSDQRFKFKRDGLYERICIAADIAPRKDNRFGFFNRDELMQLLLKLTKGHIDIQTTEVKPCSSKKDK